MKILFLTHTFPYPLNDGVRLHVYHLLKEMSAEHQIFLICLNDLPVQSAELQAIEKLGVKIVQALHHSIPQNFILRSWNTFFDSTPFLVRQFESLPLRKKLQNFLQQEKIDVIHIDYLSMAIYYDLFAQLPKVFFPHDAVSMLFERNIQSEKNILRKIYTWLQWKKIIQFETKWIPRFDSTMVVSPVDQQYLLKHCASADIAVSANGVDTDYFQPQNNEEEPFSILFRGVMNFQPNVDAVRYFLQDIFPIILKSIPQAKFYVVGYSPPEDILQAAQQNSNIICTGFVKDIRQSMADANVIVSPMRIGSGIKNKILEPMAMAKPIVSTTLSCAGLNLQSGKHLVCADETQFFADAVIDLLKDKNKRSKIGQAARNFVQENQTWKRNAADFITLYKKAIEKWKKY